MHRSSFYSLAIAALILVSCDSSPSGPEPSAAPPSFDKVKDGVPDKEHSKGRFTRTVNNPCPPVPEAVVVEGTMHFNSHFKFFDGGNTSKHNAPSHGTGIGVVTGMRYTFHEMFRQEGIFHDDDLVFRYEQTIRWHVISQSGLGNFFATTRNRGVCDAVSCRAETISVETDCRG